MKISLENLYVDIVKGQSFMLLLQKWCHTLFRPFHNSRLSTLFYYCRTMVYYRWVEDPQYSAKLMFPKLSERKRALILSVVQRVVKKQLHAQGLGRHSITEVHSIARKDLQSLSEFLHDKPFMMGQEPSLVDASAFGLLAQFVWQDESSAQHTMVHSEFKNLVGYCDRMKERYWKDWDQVIAERKKLHYE